MGMTGSRERPQEEVAPKSTPPVDLAALQRQQYSQMSAPAEAPMAGVETSSAMEIAPFPDPDLEAIGAAMVQETVLRTGDVNEPGFGLGLTPTVEMAEAEPTSVPITSADLARTLFADDMPLAPVKRRRAAILEFTPGVEGEEPEFKPTSFTFETSPDVEMTDEPHEEAEEPATVVVPSAARVPVADTYTVAPGPPEQTAPKIDIAMVRKLAFPILDNFPDSVAYVDPTHGALIATLREDGVTVVTSAEEARLVGPEKVIVFVTLTIPELAYAVQLKPTMILVKRNVRQEVFDFPEEYKLVRTDDTQSWMYYKILTTQETETLRDTQRAAMAKLYARTMQAEGEGEDDDDDSFIESEDEGEANQQAEDRKFLRQLQEKYAESDIIEHPLEELIRDTQKKGSVAREKQYQKLIDRSGLLHGGYTWTQLFESIRRLASEYVARYNNVSIDDIDGHTLFWIVADEDEMPRGPPPGQKAKKGEVYNSIAAAEDAFGEHYVIGKEWDAKVEGEEDIVNFFPPQELLREYPYVVPVFLTQTEAESYLWRWDFGFGEVYRPNGLVETTALFEPFREGMPERLSGLALINPRIAKSGDRWTAGEEDAAYKVLRSLQLVVDRASFVGLVAYNGLANVDAPEPKDVDGSDTIIAIAGLDYLHLLHDAPYIATARTRKPIGLPQARVSMFVPPMRNSESLLPPYEYGTSNTILLTAANADGHVFGKDGLMVLLDQAVWQPPAGDQAVPFGAVVDPTSGYTDEIAPSSYQPLIMRVSRQWNGLAYDLDKMQAFLDAMRQWRSYNTQLQEAGKTFTQKDMQFLHVAAKRLAPFSKEERLAFRGAGEKPDELRQFLSQAEIDAAYDGELDPVITIHQKPGAESTEEPDVEPKDYGTMLETMRLQREAQGRGALFDVIEKDAHGEATTGAVAEDLVESGGASFLLYADLQAKRGKRAGKKTAEEKKAAAKGALPYNPINTVHPLRNALRTLNEWSGTGEVKKLVIAPDSPDKEALLRYTQQRHAIPVDVEVLSDDEVDTWSYARPAYVVLYGKDGLSQETMQQTVEYFNMHRAYLDGILVIDPNDISEGVAKKRASAEKLNRYTTALNAMLPTGLARFSAVFAPAGLIYLERIRFGPMNWAANPSKLFKAMEKAKVAQKTRIELFVGDDIDAEVMQASNSWGLPPIISEADTDLPEAQGLKTWSITTHMDVPRGVITSMALHNREGLVLVRHRAHTLEAQDIGQRELEEAANRLVSPGGDLENWKVAIRMPFAVIWAPGTVRDELKRKIKASLPAAAKAEKPKTPRPPKRKAEAELERDVKRQKLFDILLSPTRLTSALGLALRGLFTRNSYVAISYTHAKAGMKEKAEETAYALSEFAKTARADFRFQPEIKVLDATHGWDEYIAKYKDSYIAQAKKEKYSLIIVCLDDETTVEWLNIVQQRWPQKEKKAPKKTAGDAMDVDKPAGETPKPTAKATPVTNEEYALRHMVILGPSVKLPIEDNTSVSVMTNLWHGYGQNPAKEGPNKSRTHFEWVVEVNKIQSEKYGIAHGEISDRVKLDYETFIANAVYYWPRAVTERAAGETAKKVESLAPCHGGRRRAKGYK